MTTLENQEYKINFLLANYDSAKLEEYKDIKLVTYITSVRGEDKPGMQIYKGRAGKPCSYYYYQSEDRRNTAIELNKKLADEREIYKAERKAKKQAFVANHEIGDIYVASWGYDQTNVDFYQVIETVGKRTVIVKELCQEIVEGSAGMMCADVMPLKDDFLNDNTFKKRVGEYGIKISECQHARKWDGTPMYNSWYA